MVQLLDDEGGAPGCVFLAAQNVTVDVVTHEVADAARERSDTTAVPAAGIILQCVIGWVLAEAVLEKFGGDTIPEIQERVEAYRAYAQQY